MAVSILNALGPLLPGAIDRIVFPVELRGLLGHLSTDDAMPAAPTTTPIKGSVKASAADSVGGFANLDIAPLGPAIPFTLRIMGPAGAPTGFQFDLEPASGLMKLPDACVPATVEVDASGKRRLVSAPTPGNRVHVRLNGADPLGIRTEGSTTAVVRQGLVALDAANRGVMTVGTDPVAFMIGSQGFGIHLAGGFTVDSSGQFAPDPVQHGNGHRLPSETPSWKGVAIRKAELFLPEQTPLIGNGPIPIEFEFGQAVGMYGHTVVTLPPEGSRPGIVASLTWDDPGATSLASALPTAVEVSTSWTLQQTDTGIGTVELLGGRPLRVTGRFARKPGSMNLEFGLVVEAEGDEGLLTVTAKDSNVASKVVVTASALATAFVADAAAPMQPNYDGFGATLHALLVAAGALSAFLDEGQVTVHGVEIDAGLGEAGTKLALRVDYSVNVQVSPIDLGFMSISMKPRTPMRLRYRNVRLLVDFDQPGLDRFHLSYGEAEVGVEDPGGWQVGETPTSLKDLFDVVGSRSGHGSQWFEIDLRFALDLGPVKVSGATVRGTLGPNGVITPEIRGLDASLVMPALLEGHGKASLGKGQLDLGLAARIVPLNLEAFASVSYADCHGYNKLVFALGVDLPGPIPLANSGLGLYGLGGIFGVHAALPLTGPDPIESQLRLDPWDTSKYVCSPTGAVFGLGAVIGTAPDLGYAFSARAVIVLGLPDFALRASLDGKVLSERATIHGSQGGPGLSFKGLLSIADDAVTVALRGNFSAKPLFEIDVPFGGLFPRKSKASGWWVHLGSDNVLGRSPGPIQAKLLPDLLDVGAWAYLMVHGDGLMNLGKAGVDLHGFALGFGAGFSAVYGVPPLVYMELSASAVIGLGTDPFLLAGQGHLAGSLHLGPVSIGASADIMLLLAPELGEEWVKFEVCGEVDLLFFSLEGCVSIEIGQEATAIPPPSQWPLKSLALSDHLYTKTADALRSDTFPAADAIPTVWPDAIPVLEFSTGPARALEPGPFTDKLIWNPGAVGDGVVGNERLSYTYFLNSLKLTEIDPATHAATAVRGPFEAAWQDPKADPSQPGARELALMTWETHLWTRKLLDGGRNLPHNPFAAKSTNCKYVQIPVEGWALGALASRHEPGDAWQLPTRYDPSPYASNFVVYIASLWGGRLVDETTAGLFPTGFPLALGCPVAYAQPFGLPDHPFDGAFALPHLTGIPLDAEPQALAPLGETQITAYLAFSEHLADMDLLMLLPRWPSGGVNRLSVQVVQNVGLTPLRPEPSQTGPEGTMLHVYRAPGGPHRGIVLTYSPELAPEVVAVAGVTASANAKAEAATMAADAASNAAASKAASQTAVPRQMLKADRIYQLDVTMSAQGQRDGTKAAGPMPSKTDRYWFRTAALPAAAASAGLQYVQGNAAKALAHYKSYVNAATLATKHDAFDPVYLERYIASWIPLDRTGNWFLDDPVGVQLLVSHVPDLALLYRHDTKVRVRRLDPTKGKPDPFEEQEIPAAKLFAFAMSALQPAADKEIYKLTSQAFSCPYPVPGGTLGRTVTLQPRSQYEAFLAFGHLDGPGVALIRGVTFGTSSHATPESLLAALGFGSGTLSGDVQVNRTSVSAGDRTADGAIDQALVRLGLGRWPVARQPRSTALWTQDGGAWTLHGMFLEAPEPIHRPDSLQIVNFGGRVLVGALSCGGQQFEQVIRSVSGDRLLFLTGSALTPAAPLDLAVTLQRVPVEVATAATHVTLSCPIAASPAFLGDLT